MHWPRWVIGAAPAGPQGLAGQGKGGLGRQAGQAFGPSVGRHLGKPAHVGRQESFLVDRLVGATALELGWAIRRDQQQGDPAKIGLHHRGQQVGHGRTGGGDHRRGLAGSSPPTQGEKRRRTLVEGGQQLQRWPLQQGRSHCQRTGATARAKHDLPQSPFHQSPQQPKAGLKIA